ncbi:hypothetical protein SAY87_021902 [Trapa incisa]|uniref:Transglycosylase SLT domain-containing protein n=1 Tax=Trapa incisa TaxID=236973 RepID=A0AAN7JU11_9MYRT|nr:hypothetical protein SAY87_021902 [Trapa incisa]
MAAKHVPPHGNSLHCSLLLHILPPPLCPFLSASIRLDQGSGGIIRYVFLIVVRACAGLSVLFNRFLNKGRMVFSFKYWNDCTDKLDMEAMWMVPDVSTEWLDAGETREQNVHLSRDPDGQAYLTQTEMRAVAEIIVRRHFASEIHPDMLCAIAELESDRQLFASRYNKKTKGTTLGIMQILPKTAEWLSNELGYRYYEVAGEPNLVYRPFVNVYFGAAYLKWLSNFEQKGRNEEFLVRAYRGGTKKAIHKSTLTYWRCYLAVRETFASGKFPNDGFLMSDASSPTILSPISSSPSPPPSYASEAPSVKVAGDSYVIWDSIISSEDMEYMQNHPEVAKEWGKSREKRGQVQFSKDADNKSYLSCVELRAVAEIILFKHFSSKRVKAAILCAIAEVSSKRFLYGVPKRPGLMGINHALALWLHNELGYKAYKVVSDDDLCNPFAFLYFGAAYMAWLSEYEGRERTPQFIVQAYFVGPQNVNAQETVALWVKFQEALSKYDGMKR